MNEALAIDIGVIIVLIEMYIVRLYLRHRRNRLIAEEVEVNEAVAYFRKIKEMRDDPLLQFRAQAARALNIYRSGRVQEILAHSRASSSGRTINPARIPGRRSNIT